MRFTVTPSQMLKISRVNQDCVYLDGLLFRATVEQ